MAPVRSADVMALMVEYLHVTLNFIFCWCPGRGIDRLCHSLISIVLKKFQLSLAKTEMTIVDEPGNMYHLSLCIFTCMFFRLINFNAQTVTAVK